jgi:hypothetical protein
MKKQRTDNFDKFANKTKGSAVKEAYRQEKKKNKLEAAQQVKKCAGRRSKKCAALLPTKKTKTIPGTQENSDQKIRGNREHLRRNTKNTGVRSLKLEVRRLGLMINARHYKSTDSRLQTPD